VAPQTARLLSLDVFRGITVAAMVLVNNPGTWSALYAPLRHADWHGWTPTDLVFPFFLFIVGVAIPFSLAPRADAAGPDRTLPRVLRRALVIFALGIVLNGVPWFQWDTLRIPGVLQRIAVCYLVAALIYLATGWRGQAIWTAALLLGYWAVMTLVAVPGHDAGDLGKEWNLAAYLDRAILGPAHLWRAAKVYDPEGMLSTVPAVATTLFGGLAGQWLRSGRAPEVLVRGLAWAGVAGLAVGWSWGLVFPINKSLWTSSYAVFTAGWALVALAVCYWLIELRGRTGWTKPFVVFGVNALALFFLSTLVAKLLVLIRVGSPPRLLHAWLYTHLFAPWAAPVNASLAYACVYLLVWWGIMWALFRAGVRLRV
jgi:predicted acyltransferase